MKSAIMMLLLLVGTLCVGQQKTAREYYEELVKSKGLDAYTNQFVCFDDEDSAMFWTFSKSEDWARWLSDPHITFDPAVQALGERMRKEDARGHYLNVTYYSHGIAGEARYPTIYKTVSSLTKQTTYVEDFVGKAGTAIAGRRVRILYTINWTTLQFKRSVVIQGHDNETVRYGTCEAGG